MDIVKTLLKNVKNEYASVAADGLIVGDTAGFIDTGSYTLNAVLSGDIYGGIPTNKIIEFAGEEATGKTFFSLSIVRYFLDSDPDAVVVLFESENAYNKKMLVDRGIDVDRMVIFPVETVQEFKFQALSVVDTFLNSSKGKDKPLLIVLDSLGMLSTTKEMEDSASGKDVRDMTRTQIIKSAFRTLTLRLGKVHIPLIYTNHVYELIGANVPTKQRSGGSGGKYAASASIMLTKARAQGKDVGGKSDDKTLKGVIITAKTGKGRLTKENISVKTLLRYDKGLDRYFGLFDIAVEAGVFIKDGNRWVVPGHDNLIWKKDILLEPEKYYTETVLEYINNYVGQTFNYGVDDGSSEDLEFDNEDSDLLDIEITEDANDER